MLRFRALKTSLAALGLIGAVETAAAQPVAIGVERIDSERPEAWAMQYFTGITSVGGFTVPERRQAGAISFGGELVWIPVMSEARRRVGFNGTKLEDLNKAPFFVRPRATVALPGALAVTIAWVPPVETFGVRPNLLAVALERPMYESTSWSVGWRAHGQTGTARAAFTCPQDTVRFPPGTLANPSGCLEPSSDTATLRYVALELSAGQSTPGVRSRPTARWLSIISTISSTLTPGASTSWTACARSSSTGPARSPMRRGFRLRAAWRSASPIGCKPLSTSSICRCGSNGERTAPGRTIRS